MAIALLDGDIIAFRAAAKAQEKWSDDLTIADARLAIREADLIVEDWKRKAKASRVVVCLSDPTKKYFRKVIDKNYKANRKGVSKPVCLDEVVQHLLDKYKVERWDGLEADDVMGILGSKLGKEAVVVTLDKDLQTVPCYYMNPDKDRRSYRISEARANLWWMTQTLTGDSTDGYKGIPRVGPKRAAAIMESSPTSKLSGLWRIIELAYTDAGLSVAEALKNARLARILRCTDWNEETQEMRLWHPTDEIWVKPTELKVERSDKSEPLPEPDDGDEDHHSGASESPTGG